MFLCLHAFNWRACGIAVGGHQPIVCRAPSVLAGIVCKLQCALLYSDRVIVCEQPMC